MIEELYIDGYQLLPPTDEAGLISISGLGSPSPKREVVSLPRSQGHVDYSEFYEGRVLSLAGASYGPSMELCNSNFDSLKAKFQLGAFRNLKFKRIGQSDYEQISVKVASSLDTSMSGASQRIRWSLDVFAQDPRIYAFTQSIGSYDPTVGASSGLELPLLWPLDFQGSGVTYLSLENEGTFPTPPIFTIEGPVTNPILDNDTTSQSFYTSGLTLAAGESAVVDMGARTFSIEGVVRMDFLDAALSSWFELQPGVNDIRLRGSGMASSQTSLSALFHNASL